MLYCDCQKKKTKTKIKKGLKNGKNDFYKMA